MKRTVAVLLSMLMCLTLCGCVPIRLAEELLSFAGETVTTTLTTTLPSVEVPMTLLENGYAYTLLNETQQANYTAVVKELFDARGQDTKVGDDYGISIVLKHPLSSKEAVTELFHAVYDDHPEFFYLTGQYGWVTIGEDYTNIRFFYIWNADERAAKATELEAAVSSLVEQARSLSPVEQERLFHDVIVERCEYNEAAKLEDEEEPDEPYYIASSPYAALCTGDPICGGYSRAFQLLLSRVGIPNTAITNEDHTWTMLWLDGEAYHTDVTWDDPTKGEEGYRCFNITDEEIRATREYPAQERQVPAATAAAYNYYVMNGWYIDDVYDGTVGAVIRSQIESGQTDVWLKFDADDYEDAVYYLMDEQAFFEAVYELEDDTLRDEWYDEVFYYESPESGVIRICADEKAE